MRGIRARALRHKAREICDPTIIDMRAVPTKIGEAVRLTAFWPRRSYRRVYKALKVGRVTGVRYHG